MQAGRVRARVVEDRIKQVGQGRRLLLKPPFNGELDAGAVPGSEIRNLVEDFSQAPDGSLGGDNRSFNCQPLRYPFIQMGAGTTVKLKSLRSAP